jgi:hypothetical protein
LKPNVFGKGIFPRKKPISNTPGIQLLLIKAQSQIKLYLIPPQDKHCTGIEPFIGFISSS